MRRRALPLVCLFVLVAACTISPQQYAVLVTATSLVESATPICADTPPPPANTPSPSQTNAPSPTATLTLAPTKPPTATTVPTATPAPAILKGVVFLDANGSGGLDAAIFQCPTHTTQSPALEYYFGPVCADKVGRVITVVEPVLPGITVCYDTACSTTGTDGRFLMEIPVSGTVRIRITDPSAENHALALRYANIRVREVPDMANGTIYDNSLHTINSSFEVSTLQDSSIGLMQGPLTSPFRIGNSGVSIWNGFDIASSQPWTRDGKQADYLGATNNGWPHPPCKTGVNDSHNAIDYCLPVDTPVLAMAPSQFTKTNIQNGVNLEYRALNLTIQLGHLKERSFSHSSQSRFLRGQQIALSGDTGDVDYIYGVIAQLHVMVSDRIGKPLDPFRNTSGVAYEMGRKYSLWSVDNLMVDPIPGQLP